MRLTLWFVLFLAFSIGMCGAFALRFLYFEAMPVVAQTAEPQVKILIAKRAIPSGVEITADFVLFQEVALSEVPLGAMTNFAQVYRRQLAYPIPAGCPICEELLLSPSEADTPTAFLPPGSQFVFLDIVHVRRGNKVFSLNDQPLSTILPASQGVDIWVVPPEAQGRLAEKKNAVLRNFASQSVRNSGDLILENVPIHRVQRQFVADRAGSVRDSLELMLDKSDAARLTAASKRGQLRVLVHQEPKKTASSPMMVENSVEVADASAFSVYLPFEPLPIDVPSISEPWVPAESALTIPVEAVQQVVQTKTENIVDTVLPPAPVPEGALQIPQNNEISQVPDQPSDSPADAAVSEIVIKEKIRNDAPVLAFGTPDLRVISEQSAEQNRTAPLLSTGGESSHASLAYSENIAESSRASQSLQFSSPNKAALGTEATAQAELVAMPHEIPALPFILLHERIQYSPFERRIYAITTTEELGESLGEIPMPPKQLRNPGLETQAP